VLPLCLVKAFHLEFSCLIIVNLKAFAVCSYAKTLELYQKRYLYRLITKQGKPFILVYISIPFQFFLFRSHATLCIMIYMILASLSHATKLPIVSERLFWIYPLSSYRIPYRLGFTFLILNFMQTFSCALCTEHTSSS
jgi:hypothetical protein